MKVIGITGGVGAGKSQILSYLKEHLNCRMVLADEAAHRVKEPGTPCFEKLVGLLGKEILTEEGTIDKGKMAARIFADSAVLAQVNAWIHPAVKAYILEAIEQARKTEEVSFFFIEAALLIEDGYEAVVDELWYIYASEEVRRKRLRESRGYSEEKISAILASQLSEAAFRAHCQVIIDNSGSLEDTYAQLDKKIKESEQR